MSQNGSDLVTKAHTEAIRRGREQQLAARVEQPSIHHTELPEPQPGSPLVREWNTYRREVGRLLAEGQQGRWVLIRGERIIGTWDSEAEAEAAGLQQFQRQPFLIHRIEEYEPLLRGPSVFWRCPS